MTDRNHLIAGSCADDLKKEEYEEDWQLEDGTGGFGTLDVKVQKEEPDSLHGRGFVKDEEVSTLAKRKKTAPEQSVGLSFEDLFPKEAVRQFCDRYKAGRSTKEDFFYRHEHTDSGVVATLVMPLLKNREFRGYAAANEKEAERSAAEAFTADTDVLEIAERLPPPFSHSRSAPGTVAESKMRCWREVLLVGRKALSNRLLTTGTWACESEVQGLLFGTAMLETSHRDKFDLRTRPMQRGKQARHAIPNPFRPFASGPFGALGTDCTYLGVTLSLHVCRVCNASAGIVILEQTSR